MDRTKLTKASFLLLKILVSGGLIYLLFSRIGVSNVVNNISRVNPLFFLAAMFIYLAQLFISTNRWSLLIERPLSLKRLYSLYLIGSFFSIFLPGLVGGDTVKAYYLNKMLKSSPLNGEAQGSNLVTAIASVFMDRYLGFVAMLIMVVAVYPLSFMYIKGTVFIWLLPLLFALFLIGSYLILRFRIGQRFGFISNLYGYFSLYIGKKTVILKTLLLSVLTQTAGITAVYLLSVGLSMDVPFISVLIFVPIIILVSFIPISIAGIGLREGAFVFFFSIIGVPSEQSLTLSILWFLSTCATSLLGLVEYLRIKGDEGSQATVESAYTDRHLKR